MADDFQYHIDHHGSLVRPAELVAARAGGDAKARLAAEDEAAVATAHEQRRLTVSAISDGQFRRDYFESVVHDHVDGFGAAAGGNPLADLAGIAPARRRSVAGALAAKGRLAEHEVAPILGTVDRPVFVQLPSPGHLALLSDPASAAVAGERLAAILGAEINALAAQGVAYVALANPLLVPLLTVGGRARLRDLSLDPDALLDAAIAADRAALGGLDAPAHFRVGLDLTDHGPLPTTEGGWDGAALGKLLDGTPFHRLGVDFPAAAERRLPFDDIRPGLAVSFGVVDVADPEPEDVGKLLAITDGIADRRDLDDVAFAPNAGFAVTADAAFLTGEQQRAKLRLVETICRYYWGNEI